MSLVLRRVRQLWRRHVQTSSVPKPDTLAVAHSSWFRLTDQGMENFELLARGSGFIVHGPTTGVPIAVTSAHVAAPHRFPAYFSHEWLKHVRDADCLSILEARCADRITGSTNHALARGFRHASLDIAAFLLDEESRGQLADIKVLTLSEEAKTGTNVSISGFRLIGEPGSGSEGLVGVTLDGVVKEVVASRGFVDTGEMESEMGMCGGPVIQDGKCAGLLEGLVPRPKGEGRVREMHERVGGCSVYVGARELRMFLHDVETESARGVESKY